MFDAFCVNWNWEKRTVWSTHPNMFVPRCTGTGQPWRIGVVALTTTLSHFSGCSCQHRHTSELPPTTALTNCSTLSGSWGAEGDLLLLCHAKCLQGKIRAERRVFFSPLCLTWLSSIQQVVAHLSHLSAAEEREVENGVLCQGWGSLFTQQDHLGQPSEPGLNIARRWANGTAGDCVCV